MTNPLHSSAKAAADPEEVISLIIEEALTNLEKRHIIVPFCDSHDRAFVVEAEEGGEICEACHGDGFSGELCRLGADSVGYELAAKIMAHPVMRAPYQRLQIDPGGTDAIDALNEAVSMLRAQLTEALAKLAEVEKERDAYRSALEEIDMEHDGNASESIRDIRVLGVGTIDDVDEDVTRIANIAKAALGYGLVPTAADVGLESRSRAAKMEKERDTALSRLAQSDALLRGARNYVVHCIPYRGEEETAAKQTLADIDAHLATATTKEGKTL